MKSVGVKREWVGVKMKSGGVKMKLEGVKRKNWWVRLGEIVKMIAIYQVIKGIWGAEQGAKGEGRMGDKK